MPAETVVPTKRPQKPEPCAECQAEKDRYWAWVYSHCMECDAELTDSNLEALNYGCEPRCDECSDRRYYETPQGKLEQAHERIAELETHERELKATAKRQEQEAASELAAVEARLKDAIAALAAQIGPRSRPSALSDS
jgi:hypothetical protein